MRGWAHGRGDALPASEGVDALALGAEAHAVVVEAERGVDVALEADLELAMDDGEVRAVDVVIGELGAEATGDGARLCEEECAGRALRGRGGR